MTKVSVIVAAYNVEEYIEDALHSMINQSLKEVEFIIVDDGSTDKTVEIIQKWAENDSRLKLIKHEKNKGLMLARKTGYDVASGEYIMFLDGDDSLAFDACEVAYKAISSEKVDMLQFETNIFSDKNVKVTDAEIKNMYSYLSSPKMKIFSYKKGGLLSSACSEDMINLSVWNKIYKKSVIEKASCFIPDQHIIMAEDLLLSFIVCFFSKSYSYCNKKLYNYRFGNGISTTKKISDTRMYSIAQSCYVYKHIGQFLKAHEHTPACKRCFEKLKLQLFQNVGYTFLTQVPASKRHDFAQKVLEHLSLEELITMLSVLAYQGKPDLYEKVAEVSSELSIFKATKKEVKTIATFYFRMYNGGVENVLSQLTDIWIKSGYNVILFTDKAPDEKDYYINPAVKRVVMPEVEQTGFFPYENRIQFLKENLTKYDVDVMVYHAWINSVLLCDLLTTKSLGIPFIVHTHNIFCIDTVVRDSYAAYFNSTLHKLYHFCDMAISLTDVDQAYWSAVGVKSIKTVNPIAFPQDTKLSELKGKNIVMVSRIAYEKNIIDALKIIEEVIKKIPDATLTIVGSGDDKYYVESVKNYIKENKLEDNVKMVGFKKDVTPYYQSADVMLITSKVEGFCLSLVESKLCGLPLVTYNLANLDTVREAKGMFVVEQDDIEGASDRIIEILSDDDLKKKMGKEARESGEEIISFDIAKHWDYIFEQALIPKENALDLQKEPLNTAIDILLDFMAEGILTRGSNAMVTPAHTAALEATVKEIRSSTSYRLGWFLTTIPRKIKDFIKGQKYVE